MLGRPDASLVKKLLTIRGARYVDTKALTQKRDEVAKALELDVSTILAEQVKEYLVR